MLNDEIVASGRTLPVQARAQKTQQALLDALDRLLAEKSITDLTVSEIAREAGVTTGAIYRRFQHKQDLVRVAFERFLDSTVAGLANAVWTDPNVSERMAVRLLLEQTMHATLDNIHLMQAASTLNDLPSFERMRKARALSADRLAERLTPRGAPSPALQSKCRLILRVATATFRDTFTAGHGAADSQEDRSAYAETHKASLTDLIEGLTDLACAYLGVAR